ncbi:MAG: hypothetical protein RMY29_020465 [Nostoc sp. CreGUA01]|nr:hypothetical protein [Nostoc sp. CreGUA01]
MEIGVQNCNIRYPRVNDAEPKAIAWVITRRATPTLPQPKPIL